MMTASWIKVLKHAATKYINKKHSLAGSVYINSPDERKDKAMAKKTKRDKENKKIFKAIQAGNFKTKKVK